MPNEDDRLAVLDRRRAEMLVVGRLFQLFLLVRTQRDCQSKSRPRIYFAHFHFEGYANSIGILLR